MQQEIAQSTEHHGAGNDGGYHELKLIIEGKEFTWRNQYIDGNQLKKLAFLPEDVELFLSVEAPWKDELILNDTKVDLARPGIECFYIKQELKYFINEQSFESKKQYISGAEIRKRGDIPAGHEVFLSVKGPWEDELIADTDWVDLARPGIEHFYSQAVDVKVVIIVNGTPHNWERKKITFKEIVVLAFGQYIDRPTMVYTVAYEDGPKQNPEGSMFPDQEVFVKNKMIFHATATDKS